MISCLSCCEQSGEGRNSMPNYKKSDNRTWRGDTTRVGHDPMGDPGPNLSRQTHLVLATCLRRQYISQRAPVV